MAGTLLFYNGSGKIAKLTGSVSGGFQIKIDGLTTTANVIITGVSLQQGVRISYFETMGASIYMYPLGNKISKIQIRGIGYANCATGAANAQTQAGSNKTILEFYDKFKLKKPNSNASGIVPVVITIGSSSFTGFLEDLATNYDSNNGLPFGMVQFVASLSVVPKP